MIGRQTDKLDPIHDHWERIHWNQQQTIKRLMQARRRQIQLEMLLKELICARANYDILTQTEILHSDRLAIRAFHQRVPLNLSRRQLPYFSTNARITESDRNLRNVELIISNPKTYQ